MTDSAGSLENYDTLQLLVMLADGKRSGLFQVQQESGTFQCWLEGGRVSHMVMGRLSGVDALAYALSLPEGKFIFKEGQRPPFDTLDDTVDDLAFHALGRLPDLPLNATAPARVVAPERLAQIEFSDDEREILREIEFQTPLADLQDEPVARRLITRLMRLGIIKERRSRLARVVIAVTHEVQGVALIDERILARWQEDLGRMPQRVILRDEHEQQYQLPVRGAPHLGNSLQVPPDLLIRTNLQAGISVLIRPV